MSTPYEQRAIDGLNEFGLSVARGHLDSVAQRAAAEGWSYTHFLGYLLDGELRERHRKRVELNLQFAKFPVVKRLDQFDFAAQPGIDRRVIDELVTGRFLSGGGTSFYSGRRGWGKPTWPSDWACLRPSGGTGCTSPPRWTWRSN